MKTIAVIFVALFAMAFAQDKVRVVEQPIGKPGGILLNPDPGYYRPSHGPQPGQVNIVPDSAFYQPSAGYQQPSAGPTFVNTRPPPYPYRENQFPGARGGK